MHNLQTIKELNSKATRKALDNFKSKSKKNESKKS